MWSLSGGDTGSVSWDQSQFSRSFPAPVSRVGACSENQSVPPFQNISYEYSWGYLSPFTFDSVLLSHFFTESWMLLYHGKLSFFIVRQAAYPSHDINWYFHSFKFVVLIFAVPSLIHFPNAGINSWCVSIKKGQRKKKVDRDRTTRGFPPLMNGVYSIKTDAGYNFSVTTLEREK